MECYCYTTIIDGVTVEVYAVYEDGQEEATYYRVYVDGECESDEAMFTSLPTEDELRRFVAAGAPALVGA